MTIIILYRLREWKRQAPEKETEAQRGLSPRWRVLARAVGSEWMCAVAVQREPLAPPGGHRSTRSARHTPTRSIRRLRPSARGYRAHFTGEKTEPGEWQGLASTSPNRGSPPACLRGLSLPAKRGTVGGAGRGSHLPAEGALKPLFSSSRICSGSSQDPQRQSRERPHPFDRRRN